MGQHPANLVFRFLLEIIVLVAAGTWAWKLYASVFLSLVLPGLIAAIWGIFNVKGDPSRSGKAPIEVPGRIRLLIEFLVFISGAWFLYQLKPPLLAGVFLALVILHYLLSIDRIKWLTKK